MTDCRVDMVTDRTVRRPIRARTAAPEGGARIWKQWWVRGCAIVLLPGSVAWADAVPSGQPVTLTEVLIDEVNAESWLRFRFLAPQIARAGGAVSYADAEADFAHLCETVARPYLVEFDLSPEIVVITLMDRPVPFGEADEAATQFIEAFRMDGETCVWEAF